MNWQLQQLSCFEFEASKKLITSISQLENCKLVNII